MASFDFESFSSLNLRNPFVVVLLGVLTFLGLDNAVFRSNLYMRLTPPITTSAKLYSVVEKEKRRPTDSSHDVLITGNSRMDYGFSSAVFAQAYPGNALSPVKFVIPGADLKWWYYCLREIDPKQSRYRAIVLQVDSFKATPQLQDAENWYHAAQSLAPIIHVAEIPDFARTFTDTTIRSRVWKKLLISSSGAGLELFLPAWQVVERLFRGERLKQRTTEQAPSQTVDDLLYSSTERRITSFPAHFDAFEKNETEREFMPPAPGETVSLDMRNGAFKTAWLKRITNLYEDSPTSLLVVETPRWPLPLPARESDPRSPDLRAIFATTRGLVFLDEDVFTDLERPGYFFDVLHLNSKGQTEFTKRLGEQLQMKLEGPVKRDAAPPVQ